MAIRCKVSVAGFDGTLTLRDVATQQRAKKGAHVTTAREVAAAAAALITDRFREQVIVLSLDARHRIVRVSTTSVGSLTSSVLHPREVFRAALGRTDEEPAAAIAIAHNHPSGDPTPSVEDHQVTMRLVEAGAVLGIRVVDHVVIGWNDAGELGWKSFAEEGWLPTR